MIKKRILPFILILLSFSASANFDFNANCVRAYKEIVALRLNKARTLIAAEKREHPKNSIPYLLDNYADYFSMIVSESKSDFERLKENKDTRLSRIEKDDRTSPWYLFSLAEINLYSALSKAVFREYFSGSFDLNKANHLFMDNSKKFPSFQLNQKGLGMINVILGSLPDPLKRTMSLIGSKGDKQTGIKMLQSLASSLPGSNYSFFYDETVLCFSYAQSIIQVNQEAYPQIVVYAQKIDTSSLLRTYILTYSAVKAGHTDEALKALGNRPSGSENSPFPFLDYLAGTALIHKLDFGAGKHFEDFIRSYKGTNNIKDAYLHLAWIALLKGNTAAYRDLIIQLKTKGYSFNEKDKQALIEADDPVPDTDLLKARLLFDGGYYPEALRQIRDRKDESFKILRDQIEFFYRMGRIFDETSANEQAISFYKLAINSGKKERYYFASNAAFRIGAIYEKKKDFKQARLFYNTVLDMKGHDYENSIENKAKEGLKRVGG